MTDFTTLKEIIRGRIVQPSDGTKYDLELQRLWNACLYNKHPLAFVKAVENNDVMNTVKFCAARNLDICVCCGGTSAFAVVDNAVVVDLSLLSGIVVDVDSKTAVVGGGALVGDVDRTLHKHDFVLPLGSFSKLGVAGVTLAGGIGFLTKSYGVTSDSVLEYDLVTASGDLIKVSDKENEDLFWGMKGFGFNFGIVTSMKFKVFNRPDLIVGGMLAYPLSRAKEVVKSFLDYYEQRNDNCLSFHMKCFVLPVVGSELLIKLHYNGAVITGSEIVQDLVDLTNPSKNTCKPKTHCEFQTEGDEMVPSGKFYFGASGVVLSEINDVIIDNLIDGIQKVPGHRGSFAGTYVSIIGLTARSNENRVDDSTSSFPFPSNMRFWVGMNGATNKEDNLDALKQWVTTMQSVNARYGLPPFGGRPEEPAKRLKGLKRKYDPENIFHNNCNNIDCN